MTRARKKKEGRNRKPPFSRTIALLPPNWREGKEGKGREKEEIKVGSPFFLRPHLSSFATHKNSGGRFSASLSGLVYFSCPYACTVVVVCTGAAASDRDWASRCPPVEHWPRCGIRHNQNFVTKKPQRVDKLHIYIFFRFLSEFHCRILCRHPIASAPDLFAVRSLSHFPLSPSLS